MLCESKYLGLRCHVHCRRPKSRLRLRMESNAIEPGCRIEWPEVAASSHNIRKLLRSVSVAPGSIYVPGYTCLITAKPFDVQHAERVAQFVTKRGFLGGALINEHVSRRHHAGEARKFDLIADPHHRNLYVGSAPRLQSKCAHHVWADIVTRQKVFEI